MANAATAAPATRAMAFLRLIVAGAGCGGGAGGGWVTVAPLGALVCRCMMRPREGDVKTMFLICDPNPLEPVAALIR